LSTDRIKREARALIVDAIFRTKPQNEKADNQKDRAMMDANQQ
jgi:hypothetical protein